MTDKPKSQDTDLSEPELRVLLAIQKLGTGTIREIAKEAGYSSVSTVHRHLTRLADKGWLKLPGRVELLKKVPTTKPKRK